MSRHLVDTDEGSVHLRSAGALGDGTAALLFHQSPSSSRMWTGVMAHLAERGIASVAADMFDYGFSDPQRSQLSLDAHAAMILDAAISLHDGPVVAIGHHTGAVFAASVSARDEVTGLMVMGYPLYGSWREKYERLGGRIGPDAFSDDGTELADLWVALNRSIEPTTPPADRHRILVDRLLAGPVWFTAYAALMAADLESVLASALETGIPIRPVFARQDAISRFEPAITELVGVEPTWIEGGPWVTIEHPDRVADVVGSFVGGHA